jgi:hypothetical protein
MTLNRIIKVIDLPSECSLSVYGLSARDYFIGA